MKTRIFLPLFAVIAALAIVFSMSAFSNSKKTIKTEDELHWYTVEYPTGYPDGVVLNGTTAYEGYYTKSEVPNSCGGGSIDCLRGFPEKLPEIIFDLPVEERGDDQILQPE